MQPRGDEHRDVDDAECLELLDGRHDRFLPRIPRGGGNRQMRRLDHDGGCAASGDEPRERLARQREADRLPNGRTDVGDRLPRRRRAQDDPVRGRVHDSDSRAGEKRNARH